MVGIQHSDGWLVLQMVGWYTDGWLVLQMVGWYYRWLVGITDGWYSTFSSTI